MHAEDAENVIEKARCRRKSAEETSRELRPVDRKLRRTSSRDSRSDTIHAVLSVLIRVRNRGMSNEKIRVLNVAVIVTNEWFKYWRKTLRDCEDCVLSAERAIQI